ncbi:hypothetical protein ACFWA9_21745 [Kitasatospora sp. NPDC059973]|uniref:hypothetical protein n=1 Tax=Kitasatospora sp. NPDC059973 TaxID=3347020 RepID=UPI0036C71AB7
MDADHSTNESARTMAELSSQAEEARDRLADTGEEPEAGSDVAARARDAAEQARERVLRSTEQARERVSHGVADARERVSHTAEHARELVGHGADQARHAVEEGLGGATDSLRAGAVRAKAGFAGFTDTAGSAVARDGEGPARDVVLQSARYAGPVLAAAGAAMLVAAAVVALSRRRA